MDSNDVIPATKEQRDTLEKAMANARYTFDFEKKELKKIEQKPACGEEDEKLINSVIELIDNGALDRDEKDYFIEKLKYLKPQNHWMPTEKQLTALLVAIGDCVKGSDCVEDLRTLYRDLKVIKNLKI